MDREELLRNLRRMQRIASAGVVLLVASTVIVGGPLFRRLEESNSLSDLLTLLATGIGLVFLYMYCLRRIGRSLGLECPHCGQRLLARRVEIAIASGKCSGCGGDVLLKEKGA